jgi:hypothetical protein
MNGAQITGFAHETAAIAGDNAFQWVNLHKK